MEYAIFVVGFFVGQFSMFLLLYSFYFIFSVRLFFFTTSFYLKPSRYSDIYKPRNAISDVEY